MTDEQLVGYLDAAADRLGDESLGRFTEAVEATRAGAILAQDAKAYSRWRTDVARRSGRAAAGGKNLTQLARDFGAGTGNIVVGEFEFRN